MKVVHLSTSDTGGAAISACRIHHSLLGGGVNSQLLVARKTRNDPNIRQLSCISDGDSFIQRLSNEWEQINRQYPKRPKGLELFSSVGSKINLSQIPEVAGADIIHLHWVAGILDYNKMVQALRGKHIVWTLHDMNPFTGGCHYAGDCRRYESQCRQCPQLGSLDQADLSHHNWQVKYSAYSQCEPFIVTPSRWLGRCAHESALMGNLPVQVIPYGLPLDTFRPLPPGRVRDLLGIDAEAKVLLFGAQAVSNRRKGLPYLIQAMRLLCQDKSSRKNLVLMIFGQHGQWGQKDLPFRIVPIGRIDDPAKLAQVYNAADLFAIPSLEDNLPNTALEALACGTPIVGFDSGGIRDIVVHKQTGYLVANTNPDELAQGLQWVLDELGKGKGGAFQERCRHKAETCFAPKLQADAYISLYKQMLNRSDAAKKKHMPHVLSNPVSLSDTLDPMAMLWRDSLKQALIQTAQTLRKKPDDVAALLHMGELLAQSGDFKSAGVMLAKCLETAPNSQDALKKMAGLAERAKFAGEITAARDCCLSVLSRAFEDPVVLRLWGSLADGPLSKEKVEIRRCEPRPYRVAAVVSTYGADDFLGECLTNLLAQSIADEIEIIVVDTASPQNEKEIVKRYQQQYANITYIRTRAHIGVYTAWNIAIQNSHAPYCISFSTNDQLRTEACELLARQLDDDPKLGLVYGDTYLTRLPHETFYKNSHYGTYQWGRYSYRRHRESGCCIGPHPMWRRSVHDSIGYFDERFVAEGAQEFWLRLGASFPVRHIDEFTGLQWIPLDSISGKGRTPLLEVDYIRALFNRPTKTKLPCRALISGVEKMADA